MYVLNLNPQSLRSVEEFARAVLSKNVDVHVLINNAGIMFGPRAETDDGHESQFGVNHLVSYFEQCYEYTVSFEVES